MLSGPVCELSINQEVWFRCTTSPGEFVMTEFLRYTVSKAEGVLDYWGELVRAQKFCMGVERL